MQTPKHTTGATKRTINRQHGGTSTATSTTSDTTDSSTTVIKVNEKVRGSDSYTTAECTMKPFGGNKTAPAKTKPHVCFEAWSKRFGYPSPPSPSMSAHVLTANVSRPHIIRTKNKCAVETLSDPPCPSCFFLTWQRWPAADSRHPGTRNFVHLEHPSVPRGLRLFWWRYRGGEGGGGGTQIVFLAGQGNSRWTGDLSVTLAKISKKG